MREGDTSFLSPLLEEIILSLCLGIFLTTLIHILHVQVFVLQIFSLVGICHMVDILLIMCLAIEIHSKLTFLLIMNKKTSLT